MNEGDSGNTYKFILPATQESNQVWIRHVDLNCARRIDQSTQHEEQSNDKRAQNQIKDQKLGATEIERGHGLAQCLCAGPETGCQFYEPKHGCIGYVRREQRPLPRFGDVSQDFSPAAVTEGVSEFRKRFFRWDGRFSFQLRQGCGAGTNWSRGIGNQTRDTLWSRTIFHISFAQS